MTSSTPKVLVCISANSLTVSTVNRALSLRDSRKKKEDTMESPNFASQRSRRICSFSPGVFVGRGLSASRRNINLETALRKIFKLNNVLTSPLLRGPIPATRFFQGDVGYSNRELTSHCITIISRSAFSCFTWCSLRHRNC